MQPLCLNEIGRQLTCTRAQAKKTGRAPLFSAASDPLLRLAGPGYEGRQTSPGPAEAGRRAVMRGRNSMYVQYVWSSRTPSTSDHPTKWTIKRNRKPPCTCQSPSWDIQSNYSIQTVNLKLCLNSLLPFFSPTDPPRAPQNFHNAGIVRHTEGAVGASLRQDRRS